jgi:UDP-glucose:(heptosyl)LPS alpha-1,3-glucosyltransferase
MHAADMLVHPTFYDPCSRVVLEAIASGLPAVTTRFNGAAEILTDNVTAHIIDDPADTLALADAIVRLADRDHRNEIAQNALALCDRIDIANHTRQMIELYQDVYNEKRDSHAP